MSKEAAKKEQLKKATSTNLTGFVSCNTEYTLNK